MTIFSLFVLSIAIALLGQPDIAASIFPIFYSITFHLLILTAYLLTASFILLDKSLRKTIWGTFNCLASFAVFSFFIMFLTSSFNI